MDLDCGYLSQIQQLLSVGEDDNPLHHKWLLEKALKRQFPSPKTLSTSLPCFVRKGFKTEYPVELSDMDLFAIMSSGTIISGTLRPSGFRKHGNAEHILCTNVQ